jgi:hypothetical protein
MILYRFLRLNHWSSALALAATLHLGFTHAPVASADDPTCPLEPTDSLGVSITKESLGKEYLLAMSMIPQAGAPTSTGLMGRVVVFERYPDGLDMYESTRGLVVTDDLPARRLVTSFPIVSETESNIVFDFNAGMKRVFPEIWYASGGGFDQSSYDTALETTAGRVFSVTREIGSPLVIRQAVQARSRTRSQNTEERMEIRYFISPYDAGSYELKEHPKDVLRHAQFFQVSPFLEPVTGRSSSPIVRFDLNKAPLKFYYSANTPEEYRESVKRGILYWNRAFGKEVVTAEMAPEGVTAPDVRHNIVQWTPWDNAGFAYADILADPKTGQSNHGQAYMTSVFAISGKARARRLLRHFQSLIEAETKKAEEKPDDSEKDHGHIHNPFFERSALCQLDTLSYARHMVHGLEAMVSTPEATDEHVLQASQDYVTFVVAHEVGHVMGLRHNFAGSLETGLTHKELDDWFEAYLKGEELPDISGRWPTSSMMEYSVFPAATLIGAQIRMTDAVLPHDQGAIQWGYFDDKSIVESKRFFATDGDAGAYADVNTFDYGAEPVVSGFADISETLRSAPGAFIETFIAAKAPKDPRDQIPLERVNVSVRGIPFGVSSGLRKSLQWFGTSARSYKIEFDLDFVGSLTEEELLEKRWKSLNHQVEMIGGVDRLIASYMPFDLKLDLKKQPEGVVAPSAFKPEAFYEAVKKKLSSKAYTEFVGLDDQMHSFTEEEKEVILERAKAAAKLIEEELIQSFFNVVAQSDRSLGLAATGSVGDDDIISQIEKRIGEMAKLTILAKDDSQRIKGKVGGAIVEVVDYKYSKETRLAASRALSSGAGSFPEWSREWQGELNKALKNEIETALTIPLMKSFETSMLSRSLRQWYLEQQEVLRSIPAGK